MGKNNFEQVYKLIPNNIGCLKICDRQCEKETVFLLPKEIEYISKKTKIPKNKIAEKHKINNHEIWIIKRERLYIL